MRLLLPALPLVLAQDGIKADGGGRFCDGDRGRCVHRPVLVSPTPQLHTMCDDDGKGCYRVAAIPNAKRGPSAEIRDAAWGERSYLKSLYDNILEGNCTRPNGKRKIVVDVGANIGLYGLYFASRGCFVHFVEALPLNAAHVRFSIDLNGLGPHARLHNLAVSAVGNRTIAMRYMPTDTGVSHAIYGSAANTTNGYFRKSGSEAVRRKKWMVSTVAAERLQDIVHIGPRNHIDFLKIDVTTSHTGSNPVRSRDCRFARHLLIAHSSPAAHRSRAPSWRPSARRPAGSAGVCGGFIVRIGMELNWGIHTITYRYIPLHRCTPSFTVTRPTCHRGAVRSLGMELNWETTVQAQARIIEALLGVYKMEIRTAERKLPHIAAVSFKNFYRHVQKMYMGLFDPQMKSAVESGLSIHDAIRRGEGMTTAAGALCAQARLMRSAA